MFCTEMHGDFLKWIVMREIHRGATLYFFVSSFIHTIVILSELVLSFVEMKANENVLHRAARRFLALDCDERVGKGKRDKEIFLLERI